jgi:hypothetical protein
MLSHHIHHPILGWIVLYLLVGMVATATLVDDSRGYRSEGGQSSSLWLFATSI